MWDHSPAQMKTFGFEPLGTGLEKCKNCSQCASRILNFDQQDGEEQGSCGPYCGVRKRGGDEKATHRLSHLAGHFAKLLILPSLSPHEPCTSSLLLLLLSGALLDLCSVHPPLVLLIFLAESLLVCCTVQCHG